MLVVTVAGALALEVVTLHATGEALAAAHCRHVDLLALGELIDGDLLADLEPVHRVETQFHQTTTRLDAGLREVPGLGLGELLRVLLAVGDLEGGVAVALGGLHLHDACRLDAEHGDGHDFVVHPHLAHGDFLANDRFQCHVGSLFLRTRRVPGSVFNPSELVLRDPGSCRSQPSSSHEWHGT